jgi:hypothetical protein
MDLVRDAQDYYRACATTLEFAYLLGIGSLMASVIVGYFFHFCWIFTIWGILYFIVLRWRWYDAYATEKGKR